MILSFMPNIFLEYPIARLKEEKNNFLVKPNEIFIDLAMKRKFHLKNIRKTRKNRNLRQKTILVMSCLHWDGNEYVQFRVGKLLDCRICWWWNGKFWMRLWEMKCCKTSWIDRGLQNFFRSWEGIKTFKFLKSDFGAAHKIKIFSYIKVYLNPSNRWIPTIPWSLKLRFSVAACFPT